MTQVARKQRMLQALHLQPVDRTPVWFMRQAGRSLPEYRAIREKRTLLDICREPELCAEVTLQPVKRLGVDAAIIFADIMTPLIGMGIDIDLVDGVGPVVGAPIRSQSDVHELNELEPEADVPEVLAAISFVRHEIDRSDPVALLGFSGAPFTLASYLLEGRSSRDFHQTKRMMYSAPDLWRQLMERLAEIVIIYLLAQVEAGADAVQLFDSWAGMLSPSDYERFVQPHSAAVLSAVESAGVPILHFGTGTAGFIELVRDAGGTTIGIDWRMNLDHAWERIGADRGIQGNLDPMVLLGPAHVVESEAKAILGRAGGRPGHIFNLGHGVHPETPVANLQRSRSKSCTGMSLSNNAPRGVLLMAYGTPASLDDVEPYYTDIRRGRRPSPELLEELKDRYRTVGGRTPLLEISLAQAHALQPSLGDTYRVFLGMKHWHPYIKHAVAQMQEAGIQRAVGVVLAPHYSRGSIGEYVQRVDTAKAELSYELEIHVVPSWHLNSHYLTALESHTREALNQFDDPGEITVVFTAHSLPVRVVADGDPYQDQLLQTSRALVDRLQLKPSQWTFSFQSAGRTADPWLGPDLVKTVDRLADEGVRKILVVPIGFLADHLEIFYDIDYEAKQAAAAKNVRLKRIRSLNDAPELIAALDDISR